MERERRGGRRGRRQGTEAAAPATLRSERYRQLVNPFNLQTPLSEERVAAIHDMALRVLEELGIKVLLPAAREAFARAGCPIDAADMVRIDRGLVARAIETAPSVFPILGAAPHRHVTLGGASTVILGVGGAPNYSDLVTPKRAGSFEDATNFVRLSQHFDVIHLLSPNVEPQDTDPALRHLMMTEMMLSESDKPIFVYARGAPQVLDCFEMLRIARGLTEEQFREAAYCYTVINTNSPRQLDIPMCQGIMDFAEHGQPSVITPFTLAGAMAPISIAGALVLAHAEALSGLVLAQLVRARAPVIYGSFTSNVDMKSGAPAFGTPEFVKASFAAGQLARHVGLPWRGSAPNASNTVDAQAAYETQFSMWGSLLGGCNMMVHSAGWLEGGLTANLEKFVLDVEMLQILAEAMQPLDASDPELAFDAIAEVDPGGHFFAAQHTMERYTTAFYDPIVSDWRNFGQWSEDGARTATERAHALARETLAGFQPAPVADETKAALAEYVAHRTEEGGAVPVS